MNKIMTLAAAAITMAAVTGIWLFTTAERVHPAELVPDAPHMTVETPPKGTEVPPAGDTAVPPEVGAPAAIQPAVQVKSIPYRGAVEHIFFHPLVAYPELAFDGDSLAAGYDDWFVTVKEFNGILGDLYKNGYVLIDIRSLYEVRTENGARTVARNELLLPEGKKPLIISVDDLNYYDYMLKNGNVYKLVLDRQEHIATYSRTPDGQERIAYDNEIVPIVDSFVREHPDFSVDGAKGLLALTGYEGILGYRTQNSAAPGFENEKSEALKVVEALKKDGWSFASHGWGHLDARKVSLDRLVKDTQRWKEEVGTLTGPTSVYVYPYGSSVLPGDAKYKALLDAGFTMLCSVGPQPYLKERQDSIMMDRRHIDGIALREQAKRLSGLFDASAVFDPVRPKR